MNFSKASSFLCLAIAVSAGTAGVAATRPGGSAGFEPQQIEQASYLADESPSDASGQATCCDGEGVSACDPCDSASCGRGTCGSSCCDLGDPWTLFSESYCGLAVGGWFSAGIYGNAHGAASDGPLGFNDVGDGFTVNQLWIFAEKATDTGGYGTDWGFRVDYVFGVDGPDTQAFGGPGWDNDWDTARDYGSALPQLYGEIAINDLSVKFGHFYTIIGWEVVPALNNFFYSHAYTMYYAEPFTHTGVLASYQLTESITAHGGWTQGWDTGFDNTFRANTFLGGVSFSLSDDATLTWACNAGDFGINAGNIYMNSFVLDLALTEKLTYIFQHDLGDNSGLGANNSEWYGINQYLQYEINDCWAVGGRFEWFRDDDGARISVNGPAVGNYYELTAGLNWRPHANVVVRPEIRYDWFDGVAAAGDLPFDGGNDAEQFSGGFDFIFTY